MSWDLFISHASEDKEDIARPLAALLESRGLKIWFDECELTLGDSLRQRIDQGLAESRFGLVILSPDFFAKEWPQKELDGLVAREVGQRKVILPVWHGVENTDVARFSPLLAGRLAVNTKQGLNAIVAAIESAMKANPSDERDVIDRGSPLNESAKLTFRKVIATPEVLVLQRFGPYVVKEFIGSGGSGLVYRVFHSGTGNTACMKLLFPVQSGAKSILNTISRGIRGLNAIDDPHIIRISDTGEAKFSDGSSFYLIMNFINGVHLDRWSQRIEGTHVAPAKRMQIAYDLTISLSRAHEVRYLDEVGIETRGLLHGDLKPANILVTDADVAVIIDFLLIDIQRLLDPRIVPNHLLKSAFESVPNTAAMGTPGFMAPEQECEGIVTGKTDIYGLGMTFTHLFEPTTDHDRMDALCGRSTRNELRFLSPLLRSMLERDPKNRPQDLHEVATILAHAAEDLGIRLQCTDSSTNNGRKSVWSFLSRMFTRG